jgi:hypothetical protein
MATIDIKAKPPLLTPDWTQMDGRNKPFLIDGPRRYAVTVVTQYTESGGSDLQTRKDSAIPSGVDHILKYFDKSPLNDTSTRATIEDYHIPLRPNAKMKVLISLSEEYLLSLPDKGYEKPDLANSETFSLNTFGIRSDIQNLSDFMTKYIEDIERFQGKVYGLDITKQSTLLTNFVTNLASLMQDNDIQFSEDRSDLIEMYIKDYEVVKIEARRDLQSSSKPINLTRSFTNFKESEPVSDKRTIKLLQNMEDILELQQNNTRVSWTAFINDYIYNPPTFDFSPTRPKSENVSSKSAELVKKDNETPVKTEEQVNFFKSELWKPETRKEFERKLDTAQDFVGDYVIGHLSQLSEVINDTEVLYTQLLNKLGIEDLVRSALECLNFPSFDFLDDAKGILNSLDNSLRQFQATISAPTIAFPDGPPIVDLLVSTSLEFAKTMANAVLGALIDLVIGILKSLFDICRECALESRTGIANADKVNYGGFNWRNLNFGAIFGQKVLNTALGAISEGSQQFFDTESLSQEILTNTVQKYDDLVDETAKKLVSASKTGLTFDEAKQIVIEQNPFDGGVFEQASKELSTWLDASSAALTPGELGNLLLGCEVSTEAKEVLENLLNPNLSPNLFPNLSVILDPSDLPKVWENLGKLIDRDGILQSIQDAASAIPESFKCLCDEDDEALRKSILAQKDPSLTQDQLQQQVDASKKRRMDRINQLLDISRNPDFLKDQLPPLYCSVDEEGNLVPGLIPRTHPVIQQAVNESLDASFDSLTLTFNEDVSSFVSSLSVQTTQKRIVPRTKSAIIDVQGSREEKLVLNPEFIGLVEQGRFAYGSLPAGSTVPGTRTVDEDTGEVNEGDKVRWNPFLDLLGFPDRDNRHGAGMWEDGQSRPTAEQEKEWEYANTRITINSNGSLRGTGGRTFSPVLGSGEWNGLGSDRKDIDYTVKFGYSPIPIEISEPGPKVFGSGLVGAYRKICSDADPYLKIASTSNSKEYQFNVPNNIAENSGINLSDLTKNLEDLTGQSFDFGGQSQQLSGDIVSNISSSVSLVLGSSIDLSYDVPKKTNQDNDIKDEYDLSLEMSPIQEGAEKLEILKLSSASELSESVKRVTSQISDIAYANNAATQPQEGYFYNLLADNFLDGVFTTELTQYLGNNNAFDESYKELMCAIFDQISESPYLDLQTISRLNLTPAKTFVKNDSGDWVPQGCTPSLLDIDVMKQRIFQEYDLSLCLQDIYPNPDEFGGNEKSALGLAKRSGIILLTIRMHVLEFLMKSIYSFYYFGYKSDEDIDDTMLSFIFDNINKSLLSKSIGTSYYNKFTTETIDLYNRNVDDDKADSVVKEENFKKACKYFIKKQVFSVSKRLAGLVQQKGDASIHTIFLEQWIPEVSIPTGSNQSRFYEIQDTGIVPKPLSNQEEKGTLGPSTTPEEYEAVIGAGTLTPNSIKRMSGDPGSYGILRLKPIGQFFREYFFPTPVDGRRPLSTPNNTGTEDQNNLAFKRNEIWPSRQTKDYNSYRINNGYFGKDKTRTTSRYSSSREAALLGAKKNASYLLTKDITGAGVEKIKPTDQIGVLKYAQSFNQDGSVADYIFDYGVSESEKQMMTRAGGLVDFITSARNWTLWDLNEPSPKLGDFIPYQRGWKYNFSTTSPTSLPWWGRNTTNSLPGYYSSRNVVGPGSLLWSISRGAGRFAYDSELKMAEEWKNFVLRPNPEIGNDWSQPLTPSNSDWAKNVQSAIDDVKNKRKKYISLLDLDLKMALNTLEWEKSKYQEWRGSKDFTYYQGSATIDQSLEGEQLDFFDKIIAEYDNWIEEMRRNVALSRNATKERQELRDNALEILQYVNVPRNPMTKPGKLFDITNGNFFLEYYIRVDDYTPDRPDSPPQSNLDYIAARDSYLKNVVNIEHWNQWYNDKFSSTPTNAQRKNISEILYESQTDCGERDINDPQTKTDIIDIENPQLDDYFKSLNWGIRISYLPKPGIKSINPVQSAHPQSITEKSYIITDTGQKIYPIPVIQYEIPIDMTTKISNTTQNYFKNTFENITLNGFSIPRQLIRGIQQTDEYDFVFKYAFSLDRMLSLTNIYSSTYLSTFSTATALFEPTKEQLMYLFMSSLRAGDYRGADCFNTSLDISNAILNGIPIPYAAIAKLLVRTPLLIFKGFMEQSNLNIAITKQIKQSIKAINQTIANAKRQANALQAATSAAGQQLSAIADISVSNEKCGFGISSPQALVKPPKPWFDPIDENFIPIPETWQLGLALFPSDIFFFLPLGAPITPFGLAYWALDDSRVNWFNELPLEDYIEKWLKGEDDPEGSQDSLDTQPCTIDVGLKQIEPPKNN